MPRALRVVVSDGVPVPAVTNEVESFEEFFEAESRTLFRRMCLVTGNRHEAEEVMQDAFLMVFERWDRVRDMDDPVGYLYRVAFNDFKRRSRRAALALRRTVGAAHRADEFEAAEARDAIDRGLAHLARRQRAALVLTELLGFTSEEAASVLGIRAVTVRSLASRGRIVLRQALGGSDE
jgi:RNA polymerase sigma factor (sigma-70 family)